MAALIYVVVCSRGGGKAPPYNRPIVLETEVDDATLAAAQARAAGIERYSSCDGACRIGRVVFEDEPGFLPPTNT